MINLDDIKRLRYSITLISILFIFIFGFYICENIYWGKGNTASTVILEEELFSAKDQYQYEESENTIDDNNVNAGLVEYTKTIFKFKDSGETIVTEAWLNPKTLEGKTNYIVTLADHTVEKNFTAYTMNGAKHYINILRDKSGKAESGSQFYYSDERAKENAENLIQYDVFAGRKEMYMDMTFWKDKGKIISDGKTLKKLLCGDEQNGNTTMVFIDESTGFPVKEEAYVRGKQFSTMTYEFKYVVSNDKLFDASTEGVDLVMLGQIESIKLK